MKFERYGSGIVRGLMVTFKHLFRHPPVAQYPEQRLNPSRRIRGNELIWNDTRCTGCATCAKSCPQGAIRIGTAADPETSKYAVVKIEVDTGYCIQCGLCVEACPYEAIYMGYSVERAKYRRGELVQANEMLLGSPRRPASGYMTPRFEKELPRQTLLLERIVEKR